MTSRTKRVLTAAPLAVLGALGLAASAGATMTIDVGTVPTAVSATSREDVDVTLDADFSPTSSYSGINLTLDDDFRVRGDIVPNCGNGKIALNTTPTYSELHSKCGDSLVGMGTITNTTFGTPFDMLLEAYNGPLQGNGDPTIRMYMYGAAGTPVAYYSHFSLRNVVSTSGTDRNWQVPVDYPGGWSHSNVLLWFYAGDYISAKCADANHVWDYDAIEGGTLTASDTQTCTPL